MDVLQEGTGGSKKRSRSTAPSSADNGSRLRQSPTFSASSLRDHTLKTATLNELLLVTSSHESNYALDGDSILKELVKIAFDCLEWRGCHGKSSVPTFRSRTAWFQPPTEESNSWAIHCREKLAGEKSRISLENLKLLESVLVILRNLSFVAANLRLLAYSSETLSIFVGCLYEGIWCKSSNTSDDSSVLAYSSLHALVNLAPYLDTSGQKLFCDKLFFPANAEGPQVPNPSSFGQAAEGRWGFGGMWLAKRLDTREDMVSGVPQDFFLQIVGDYLVQVWSIFPALTALFFNPETPRVVIMMAMDLLQDFIEHARVGLVGEAGVEPNANEMPSIRNLLVNIPDIILDRLMDLLYVPRLGPDSLEYIDPVHNIVTRVTTLKLLMGYDATVDTDVRDRALDALVPLMELDCPHMAKRIGTMSRGQIRISLYDSLVPILVTQVGRNEASQLTSQLFRELAKAKENLDGILYVKRRLLELASRDSKVANLVLNHLDLNTGYSEDNDDVVEGLL